MLTVDARTINPEDMGGVWREYGRLEHLRQPFGRKYGICMRDAIDTISLVLYLRDEGASVLLIHGDTPEGTALELARKANCDYLLYGIPERHVRLNEHEMSGGSERPGLYQFSSGTTGHAKQIHRPWHEVETEIAAYNDALGPFAERRPIVWASVSHAYGLLSGVLAPLSRGKQPIVVSGGRNPKRALQLLRDHPGHLLYAVPMLLQGMAGFLTNAAKPEALMTSGAPMPAMTYERLAQAGAIMLQQYGCTELGCVSIAGPMTGSDDLGLALRHYRIRTASEPGLPGEIVAETASGAVGTSDLGLLDRDGRLRFLSRMDDVINAGGLKIYPSEVEDVITRMPGVEEAVVFRGMHPVIGEMARAFVVTDGTATPGRIRDWCLQSLPPYKVPSDIAMVPAIPRTPGGKISRRMLELEEGNK